MAEERKDPYAWMEAYTGDYVAPSPWTQGGRRWATNGLTLVSVPDASGREEKGVVSAPKYLEGQWPADGAAGEWKPWPAPDARRQKCETCRGTGQGWKDCPTCHGDGLCTCITCDDEHECGKCKGSGEVLDDQAICEKCGGTKAIMADQRVGDHLVREDVFSLVAALPGCEYWSGSIRDAVPIRFAGEGRGLVMPWKGPR